MNKRIKKKNDFVRINEFLVDTLNLSVDEVKSYEMSQIDKAIESYLFTEDKQNLSQILFELRNHS